MGPDEATGASLFVEGLERCGVEYVFGNPGTTELPILRRLAHTNIEYVLALHEDIAVGMAAGYAVGVRHRGRDDGVPHLGVVNLHIAPGVAHGLGNLYNAYRMGTPLLVTAGNHARSYRSADPPLGGDLVRLTEDVTKWAGEVKDPDEIPRVLRDAVRTATTPPTGPVFLSIPLDVQRAETAGEVVPLGEIDPPAPAPAATLDQAADHLRGAEDPVIVVGDRVAQEGNAAIAAAVRLAEGAGARVHSEVLAAEASFPHDHELWVSPMPPDEERIRSLLDADVLVLLGCSSLVPITAPEGPLLGEDTTLIEVGYAADNPGISKAPDVEIEGHLTPAVDGLADRLAGEMSEAAMDERLAAIGAIKSFVSAMLDHFASPREEDPERMSKPEVVSALAEVAPDAYIVDEGVTATYVLRAGWDVRPGRYLFSKAGGLGFGAPATLGAGLAIEDGPVVGYVGDGSYLYYPQVAFTAARHGIDVTFLTVDNEGYRILKDNLRRMFDDVSEEEYLGMDLAPRIDLAGMASAQAIAGMHATTIEELRDGLQAAIEHEGPAHVNAAVHD